MNCNTAFWKQNTTDQCCDNTETGKLVCIVLQMGLTKQLVQQWCMNLTCNRDSFSNSKYCIGQNMQWAVFY